MGKIMFNGVEYGGGSGGSSGGEIISYNYPIYCAYGGAFYSNILIDTAKYKRIGVYYYQQQTASETIAYNYSEFYIEDIVKNSESVSFSNNSAGVLSVLCYDIDKVMISILSAYIAIDSKNRLWTYGNKSLLFYNGKSPYVRYGAEEICIKRIVGFEN